MQLYINQADVRKKKEKEKVDCKIESLIKKIIFKKIDTLLIN